MTLAELVFEQVKGLPEPLAKEVLAFVSSLREREESGPWRDLMAAQSASLSALWDNADDAVWDDC